MSQKSVKVNFTKKVTTLIFIAVFVLCSISAVLQQAFSADNDNVVIESNLEKYVNYKLSDEEAGSETTGTLVQYDVKAGIEYAESYRPIKETDLTINLNQIDGLYADSVKVIGKSTKVTNGKTTDIVPDYTYDSNTGILKIHASNNDNGNIISENEPQKDDRDEYVVICDYKNAYTEEKPERDLSINITYVATLFENNATIEGTQSFENNVTDDISSINSIISNSQEIYNGKIKSNIINGTNYSTEYTENNQIMVSKQDAQDKIYYEESDNIVKNFRYKNITFNKQDIIDLLGEDGELDLLDKDGNTLLVLNKDTQYDENNKFTYEFENDINAIQLKTSKIQKEGYLNFDITKEIKPEMKDLSTDKIETSLTLEGIKVKEVKEDNTENTENATVKVTNVTTENDESTDDENVASSEPKVVEKEEVVTGARGTKTQEIKNTETNVDVDIDNTELTNEMQNDVTFTITLDSSSEKYSLFKNPTIKINLPNQVEKVILGESNILYANNLAIKDVEVQDEKNGTKSIFVQLDGTQTEYVDGNSDLSTTLKIPAKLIINKDAEDAIGNVNITYTNQFGSQNEQGSIDKSVKIIKYNPSQEDNNQENVQNATENIYTKVEEKIDQLVDETTTQVMAEKTDGIQLNVTTTKGNKTINDGDTVYTGEFVKYAIKIKNTTNEDINNVKVVGSIPEGTKYGELESQFGYANDESKKKYSYNFDEDLTEKEIDVGTIKGGQTITKYYEVQVKDMTDDEIEKDVTTTIKSYVGNSEADSKEVNYKIEKSDSKVFLWTKNNGENGEWDWGMNIVVPEGQSSNVTLEIPKEIDVTPSNSEDDPTFMIYIPTEYNTTINEKASNLGVTLIPNSEMIQVDRNKNIVKFTAEKSGTYVFETKIKDESKLRDVAQDEPVYLNSYATIENNGKQYISNENKTKFEYPAVTIKMTSPTEGEEVKYNDYIIYDVQAECTGTTNYYDSMNINKGVQVNLYDYLPENVVPVSIVYDYYDTKYTTIKRQKDDGEEYDYQSPDGYTDKEEKTEALYNTSDLDGNTLPAVDLTLNIPANEVINVKIIVKAGLVQKKTEIENKVTIQSCQDSDAAASNTVIKAKTSNVIKNTILPKVDEEEKIDPENPNNPDKPNTPNKPSNPNNPNNPNNPSNTDNPNGQDASQKYSISGVIWNDENQDGEREDSEEIMSGVEVLLLNQNDLSNIVQKTTTTKSGYNFENIEQGNYVVAFKYDTSNYAITTYQKKGIAESKNSDATLKTINVSGENLNVGLTDIISLTQNRQNIDIGLFRKQEDKISLDKTISEIVVKTNKGTKQYSYNDTKLAKVDIRAKEVEGATVSVKYNIKITNNGTTKKNVGDIIDKIPDGFTFSKSQNKSWTEENGNVVNKSLANQSIPAGESKDITLTLTKEMSSENTGTFVNNVSIKDTNLTSQAQLIISISTGIIKYIIIIAIIAVIILVCVMIILKFKIKPNNFIKLGMGIIALAAITFTTTQAYGYSFIYTGNGYTTHGFYGGAYGEGGDCNDHRLGAAGWNVPQNICPYCKHSTSAYYYDDIIAYNNYYGATRTVSGDSRDINLVATNSGSVATAYRNSGNYVLGPFTFTTDCSNSYDVIVHLKNGAVVSGSQVNVSGSTSSGSVTFYVSLSEYDFSTGVSTVEVKQSKTWHYVYRRYRYERWRYRYAGGTHQGVDGNFHLDSSYDISGSKVISKSVEWYNFNSVIGIYKEDQETGAVMDFSGTISGGGWSENFTTTNGVAYFNNKSAGEYTVTETANDNYGYGDNVGRTWTVYIGSGMLGKITAQNKRYTGVVSLQKTDYDTEKPLAKVGFKLKSADGYVIASTNGTTGNVHINSMEYGSEDEATIFYTDDSGQLTISNLLVKRTESLEEAAGNSSANGGGSTEYTFEEVELGGDLLDYYDLDTGYIYTSSGDYRFDATTTVTRKNASITDGAPTGGGESVWFKNKRKYIDISGLAWEDGIEGKGSYRNNLYDEGGDHLLANVTVGLRKSGTTDTFYEIADASSTNPATRYNAKTSTSTDANGEFKMKRLEIDQLPNYTVIFTYNGMSYEACAVDLLKPNGNKSTELDRAGFNGRFSTIQYNEALNGSNSHSCDLRYSQSNNTSTLIYGDNPAYGYEGQKFPINDVYQQFSINAETPQGYLGNSAYNYSIDDIREKDIREIGNLNLGVYEREQPDMALIEDIDSATITLNRNDYNYQYPHTYKYGQRDTSETSNEFNAAVKFENKYRVNSYTRPVYPSDVIYNRNVDSNSLRIYVTYKIAIKNESSNLTMEIKGITNYYDEKYLDDEMTASAEYEDSNNKQMDSVGIQKDVSSQNGYKKVTFNLGDNSRKIAPQGVTYVYVQFRLGNDAVNEVLNGQVTLHNISEVAAYSTYDAGGNVYGGIDKDSNPENATIGDHSTYEDDTDEAPSFIIELNDKGNRVVKGTIWEDEALAEKLGLNERIGDGNYSNTENVVQNVDVSLIDIGNNTGNEKLAKIYPYDPNDASTKDGTGTDAKVTTNAKGEYSLDGIIPGEYVLRFSYGDKSVIYDTSGNIVKQYDSDGNQVDHIRAVDYKSTIYRGGNADKVGVGENESPDDKELWYREETTDKGAHRWSDARDRTGEFSDGEYKDNPIDIVAHRTTDKSMNQGEITEDEKTLTTINADTEKFKVNMDYDVNKDNISEYNSQMKCIFDNLDFGIIKRPIQRMTLTKRISNIKVTLANGQVLIDGDPQSGALQYVRVLPADENGNSNLHVEIDGELIQGAKVELTYDLAADTTGSELDYNSANYYIFGTDKVNQRITKATRLFDYLSNDLSYDEARTNEENTNKNVTKTSSTYWNKVEKINDSYDWLKGGKKETITNANGTTSTITRKRFLTDEAYGGTSTGNNKDGFIRFANVYETDAFSDMQPNQVKHVYLVATKLLSNTKDDMTYQNDAEIVEILNGPVIKGSKNNPDKTNKDMVPGNYVPTTSQGTQGGPHENDDDYKYITITPPTGESATTRTYRQYIIAGIVALVILSTGVIIIKKKLT